MKGTNSVASKIFLSVVLVSLGFFSGGFLAGCGSDLPFTAQYTSPNQVIIMYQGKKYTLERYGIPASVPFSYRFEQDGDLDLTINNKLYEVDSPYDRDKKKKKKKKKVKTSSAR
ncbi:MAG: hypothetical protein D3918_08440 [Candidatus Electrothrix sp. AX2]|jgi:hypothetical protein|nr:hypothetical protein [Candidatus Electrothrix gigas]